jgi:phospholipid-binding lipoprotein MlaA
MAFTTPLIRRAFLMLALVAALAGCAAPRASVLPEEPPMHTAAEFSDDENLLEVNDPWEEFNLKMYRFNYNFDKYVFIPVVAAYEDIAPVFVQTGVSNFFSNVGEFRTFYNSLLQFKGKKSLVTLGRFLTNSTIGVGGLFDPATRMGMKRQSEDFGQTLGAWGLDAGPYFVVPVLGPNTLRSAGGFAVDSGVRWLAVKRPFDNIENGQWILTGIEALEAVDARHRMPFRYYETGYPFEYYIVRYLYLKYSEFQLMK